jgi:LysR family transcriptional activator of nhaA
VAIDTARKGPERTDSTTSGRAAVKWAWTRQRMSWPRSWGGDLPSALDGAPFLMPWRGSALRRPLEHWLEEQGLRPRVVGEFQDSSMLRAFGAAGHGVFPVPAVVEAELRERHGLRALVRLEEVRERFYAVSPQRRLDHPAARRITEAARGGLFESPAG